MSSYFISFPSAKANFRSSSFILGPSSYLNAKTRSGSFISKSLIRLDKCSNSFLESPISLFSCREKLINLEQASYASSIVSLWKTLSSFAVKSSIPPSELSSVAVNSPAAFLYCCLMTLARQQWLVLFYLDRCH